ncbi:MAG: hypothetical protein JNL79_00860 [Myxococcales bacterium]|nr:hypothetical protein [Myxococcales bacterium]
MRLRNFTTLALFVLPACAPAAPPPVPPKPVPVVKAPPPPPPSAARWVFHDTSLQAHAQVSLAKGEVLQVGDQGRRWTVLDGKATPAETLAVGHLVDVRVDDGKYAFLGSDGAYQVADTPLGAISRRGEGPTEKARSLCFGKKALLGVTEDGLLLRAADPTAKWSSTPLPLKPGEKAMLIESDRKGRVLVLLSPQRLLLSSDDGATFAPLALSGIGAESLLRDGNDDLFLRGGFALLAKLSGDKLVNGEKPAPLAKTELDTKEDGYSTTYLAGDRVAVVTTSYKSGKRKTEIALGGLGDKLGERHLLGEDGGSEVKVDGYGSNVLIALEDYDGDPYVRVFTTSDDGKTITPAGSFEGRPDWPFRLFAGPKGWAFLSGLCESSGPCAPPQVRIGGAWKPLSKKVRIETLAFDEKNDRVYFYDRETRKILSLGLTETTPTELGVDTGVEAPHAMTVDDTGTLRIVHGRPLRLTRVSSSGGAQPPLYLPFETYAVAFAGVRGLATAVGGGGYETMDGGEHWAKVAVAGYGQIDCTKAGCLAGRAMRVGWDLPAIGGEMLAATDEPKAKKPDAVPNLPPAEAQVKIECTYEDKWTKVGDGYPSANDLRAGPGDVRWIDFPYGYDKGPSISVARAGAAPKTIKLLDVAKPKGDKQTRPGRTWSNAGVVAAQYTFGPKKDGAYSPVDVELGFYDGATGKVGKAKIPQVKPFRVGRSSVSAVLEVVEGGVLFLPENDEAPIYFAKLDGKVESFPRPPKGLGGGRWRNAVKVGKQVALTSGNWGSTEIAYTKDLGKTWTTTIWTPGVITGLAVENGVPVLKVGRPNAVAYPLDTLGADLPAGHPFGGLPAAPLAACDAKSFTGLSSTDALGKALLVKATPKAAPKLGATPSTDLVGSSRISFYQGGKACSGGLWAASAWSKDGTLDAVIAPHDLAHGYLLKQDKGVFSSTPLTCKAP